MVMTTMILEDLFLHSLCLHQMIPNRLGIYQICRVASFFGRHFWIDIFQRLDFHLPLPSRVTTTLASKSVLSNLMHYNGLLVIFMMSPSTPTGLNLSTEKSTEVANHFSQSRERIVLSRYSIQPVRIKSIMMTRVVEGYRARRYGHDTQDINKVYVHFVLSLAGGVTIHYEITFLSSPYHIPTVGQAHVKLELSGDDSEFLHIVKKMFASNSGSDKVMFHGRRISDYSKAAANTILSPISVCQDGVV